ncbi:MAG: peptide/nickel transport system substrate-binding protein [Roseibaca calidilacus]|uniref:Peptide/nickel transport system substrate-binding protein n=1 Tax=Roseibaca calidilacus TaxID=1666912 RepID=A0A0P7WS54_9RHOB|nr:MAG: peptide/nickel transport system substrate-binding protein [Roseibaca calidilacus]CUX81170.1 peptide/nickel transport system substrate-binding protein [Roseibaca calidilacus]
MQTRFGPVFAALSLLTFSAVAPVAAVSQPTHGIAMYGEPALPQDFAHLPHTNPDAPKGGRIVQGEVGSFDSLNPHILKGNTPWQLQYLAYEGLMGRSWDEPFTLYGLLAESIEVDEARSWVEFTLRPEARFSDGSPVTVEDVLWSFETLGTIGHPRYHGTWARVAKAEAVGARTVRFTFTAPDRELPLILGLRPVLKKAQWEGVDFAESGTSVIPIASAPYVVDRFEAGRSVVLKRNPDYWGRDLPFMRGQANLDEIRMEFFGDSTAMFEAFTAGLLTTMRETSANAWNTRYDFPAVQAGEVVKSEIPHRRPSGITGFVMNQRNPLFADWRVREAMIHAFNFEYIAQVVNDGQEPRITSYFSNSELAMQPGAATGREAEFLAPFADSLTPGTLEGYTLPASDGSVANRRNMRAAMALLADAGWQVDDGGVLRNAEGVPFEFTILIRQGARNIPAITEIYAEALNRLGMQVTITQIDSAQYTERTNAFDFDVTHYTRGLSLSPGAEQRLYWGSDAAETPGSRNWMGVQSPAIDALIERLLTSTERADFVAATRALDRVLTAGRHVVPFWFTDRARIAHDAALKYPDTLPAYGDWIGFQPDVWWYAE